jgi:uncharacterized protein
MSNDTENTESLLKFPCDFLLKVFGKATEDFELAVLSIIRQHCPKLREDAVQQRNSKQGKYLALSIMVHVESQAQLDQIYRALSSCSEVVMVL